ncbi:hypothetical protein ABK040_010283 [Willaertia magna]
MKKKATKLDLLKVELELEEFILNDIDKLFDDIFKNTENQTEITDKIPSNSVEKENISNSIDDILKEIDENEISEKVEELFGEIFQRQHELKTISVKKTYKLLQNLFNSLLFLTIGAFYHQIQTVIDVLNVEQLLQFLNFDSIYCYRSTFKNAMTRYIGQVTLM